MYIWEDRAWPNFVWDDRALLKPLAAARLAHGILLGQMKQLGFEVHRETEAAALVADAVQTSAIEGKQIDAEAIRSSLAKRAPGLIAGRRKATAQTDGLATLLLDTLHNYAQPLSIARLLLWHELLGKSFEDEAVAIGRWRDDALGPMQVVSGHLHAPRVHFEAPPAARVSQEMSALVSWFNQPPQDDGLIRSAVAHLWFVTVHPFDDGNGRLARALGDLALSQDEKSGQRLFSLASQIMHERNAYYAALEQAQHGSTDITAWLTWYLGCFQRAVQSGQHLSASAVTKARFWQAHCAVAVSERQRKVLNRVLDGFEGNLTAKKWAALCRVSVDTAQRDIADLVTRGLLRRNSGGGKRTSYSLT